VLKPVIFPLVKPSIERSLCASVEVQAIIPAKILSSNSFLLPGGNRMSAGFRLGRAGFQNLNDPLLMSPLLAANCDDCATHKILDLDCATHYIVNASGSRETPG